ncbi:MAG: hypothetical protein AAFV53_03925 [Myxococcota bacterium]
MRTWQTLALTTALLAGGCSESATPPKPQPPLTTGGEPIIPEGARGVEAVAPILAAAAKQPAECEALSAHSAALFDDLITIVETRDDPPWMPLRAVECLMLTYPRRVQPRLEQWVTDPDAFYLTRVILYRSDALPEDVAVAVMRRAFTGPDAPTAKRLARRSKHPAVQALVKTR